MDVRFAARLLIKDRSFTAPAVAALALGIGMSGAMFSIVHAMVRGLPIENPDRIMSINSRDAAGRWHGLGISYLDFRGFQNSAKTLSGIAAFSQGTVTLADGSRAAERASAAYISANTFQLLGDKPILGRDFVADDDRPGAAAVVILGHAIWTGTYNADPSIVGRVVRVNGIPATVIGVMPDGFRFPIVSDVWQPLTRLAGVTSDPRDARRLQVVGRLADGKSRAQAQADIESIAMRLAHDYPATNATIGAVVAPFPGHFAPDGILLALMTAVGLVWLAGCINVANLLLARSVARSSELSTRVALGATRWRVVRQLLVESALLAAVAGVLAFGVAVGGLRLFASAVSGITFPYYIQWTPDRQVIAFLAFINVAAALLVGLLPAVQASRLAAHSLTRDERTTIGGSRKRVTTTVLLTCEVALTMILLAGAGLLMRSFLAVYRADSIVDAAQIVAMPIELPDRKYFTPDQRTAAYARLAERVAAIPGVSAAGFASVVPFAGGPSRLMSVDGRRGTPGESQPMVSYVAVRGRYFDTLGLQLLRGRPLDDRDAVPGAEGAIVNQRLAALFFSNEDPIGRRICLSGVNERAGARPECATIVGVSPTVRQQYFQELDPVVFVPDRGSDSGLMLIVRSQSNPDSVTPSIRAEVAGLDSEISLSAISPLDRAMTQSRWGHRVFGGMLTAFAVVGLILAAVGLYAVTAFSVVQRTREIGIRMALGSRPGALVWLFVGRASWPIGIGLGVGFAGALALGRLLRRFLIQTAPAEPVVLVSIAALLVAVSLAAAFFPARRATRFDPVRALRYE